MKALAGARWAEAHASFLAAWKIKPHYQIASNLGFAELRLGKHRDAAEHLTWYLHEAPTTKVEERKRAEALLKEALAKVMSIRISVTPEGAEVLVDRSVVGTAPMDLPVFVDPGDHTVGARLEGHVADARAITATAGGNESVALALRPIEPAVAAPAVRRSATPAPSRAPAKPAIADEVGPNRTVIVAGGVTAGVVAGLGVVFAVVAAKSAGDADEKADALRAAGGSTACAAGQRAGDCEALRGLREDASTFTNAAGWSFIGAGAIGAGTLIYWLAAPRGEVRGGVTAGPMVGPGGGGLVVRGAW